MSIAIEMKFSKDLSSGFQDLTDSQILHFFLKQMESTRFDKLIKLDNSTFLIKNELFRIDKWSIWNGVGKAIVSIENEELIGRNLIYRVNFTKQVIISIIYFTIISSALINEVLFDDFEIGIILALFFSIIILVVPYLTIKIRHRILFKKIINELKTGFNNK